MVDSFCILKHWDLFIQFPIFGDIKVGPMSQWQMTINHWNGYGWRDFNCCQMSSKSSLSLSSKSNSGEKVIINSYEINQIFKKAIFYKIERLIVV